MYIASLPITHSSVAGSVPDAADMEIGALAVNVADAAIYTKNYLGAVVRVEGDAGNATLASAATLALGAVMGAVVDVSGATTITAITLRDGQTRIVRFTGVLTLTHGAILVLPGGANITTVAGDYATFRGYAAGVVRCTSYSFASAAEQIHAATSKTTPLDADELALADSAASWGLKKLTWANLKATLAAWINGGLIPGSFTTLIASGTGGVQVITGKHDGSVNAVGLASSTVAVASDTAYALATQSGNGSAITTNNLLVTSAATGIWDSTGLSVGGSITTGSYTTATRPAHAPGKIIYVSDGAAGANFQGSHAGAWVNLG